MSGKHQCGENDKEEEIIKIIVHPNAKEEKMEKLENIDDVSYRIYVKEKAKDGKANKAVIKFVKRNFKAEDVIIIKGEKSRKKLIKIINPRIKIR